MTLMRKNTVVFLLSMGCSLLVLSTLRAQDAKIVADNLEYSREFYSGVHFSAIAESEPSFGYQRYPDDGPERIQCNAGTFARQHGKPWLRSEDWGQSGRPVDQQMARKLDGRVKLVDAALAFAPSEVKLINKSEAGHRVQRLFEARGANETGAPVRLEFDKPLYDKNSNVLLHGFEGSLPIAGGKAVRSERVKFSFGYLIAQSGFELSEAAWENLETPKELENKPIDLSKFDMGPKPKDAEGFVQRASARGFNGDMNGAIADCTRAIDLDPKSEPAVYRRGALKLQKGDNNGAIADLTSAIGLNEKLAIAYKNRGDAKQAKGDASGANEDLKRAGELDPELMSQESRAAAEKSSSPATQAPPPDDESVADLVNRGIEKGKDGDLDGAIADFTRASELDPKDDAPYYNRAQAKWLKKDSAGAIADYTQAIELGSTNPAAYNNPGNARAQNNDRDGAIADYTRAIELKPDYARAYYNRAVTKKAKGDKAGAAADFKRAKELDPKLASEGSAADHVDRGIAKGKKKESAASVEDFFNRAGAKKAAGDLDGAIADYDRAIQLAPKDAAIYNNRGLAKQEKGDLDAAIVDFNRAIQLNLKDAVACSNRGNTKRDKGDLDGAIADYNRAIRLDPKYAYAYYDRGLAKKQKSDLDGAIADYNRVIELDPRFAN